MKTGMTAITEHEFELLKAAASHVEEQREENYLYVCLFDPDGCEIAFAAYTAYDEPEFFLRDEPEPPHA